MKSKIKKFINSKLFIFIITAIVFSTIGVSAATLFPSNNVTYDNKESGLKSTDVQGAIDELYNECFPPVQNASEIIIENGGLEKDQNECRYFFTGQNPNNYITFNDEKAGWRIISVECDGTIKIIKINSIGNMQWDSSNNNNWDKPASLNTYLNITFADGLNTTSQRQIISHDFSIGAANNENSEKWNGYIALPTVSEYLRTNSDETCKTIGEYNNNVHVCRNSTWMFSSSIDWWTLTKTSSSDNYVFSVIYSGGYFGEINSQFNDANRSYAVRPTLYLNANVKLSGNGTRLDPYTLSL